MFIQCDRCKYTITSLEMTNIIKNWKDLEESIEMPFLLCPKCFNRMHILKDEMEKRTCSED